MKKKTKLFFDTEFTGLHQKTTLISIGIVSDTGKYFYAEFSDYDKSQVDKWLQENIIDKLIYKDKLGPAIGSWESIISDNRKYTSSLDMVLQSDTVDRSKHVLTGPTPMIVDRLKKWLAQFEEIEMWSDCLSYDWVLFCELFGHAFNIPNNIYYIPFDICTLFKIKGIDPDISREKYAFGEVYTEMLQKKHTALWDAEVIKGCYEKLMS